MAKDKKMSGFKKAAIGLGSTAGGSMGISLLDNLARAFGVYKNGGRVEVWVKLHMVMVKQ